jgi:ubiquitin-protein ligase
VSLSVLVTRWVSIANKSFFCTGFFTTKIFHPNVSEAGEICVNTLKKDWNPNLGLRHVLTVRVRPLTTSPVHAAPTDCHTH